MRDFRSKTTAKKYADDIAEGLFNGACRICIKNSIKEFDHWRIVENSYPYDRIAETHAMLVSKRHVNETGLTTEEILELHFLKNTNLNEYDFIAEGIVHTKSIPEHSHRHLLTMRDFPEGFE